MELTVLTDGLCSQKGLATANDVILTGGSAGGLTAYLQADHFAARLAAAASPNPAMKFAALGDAGFFLDHLAWDGRDVSRAEFSYAFNMWNSSTGVNDACIAANTAEPWKCIFAQCEQHKQSTAVACDFETFSDRMPVITFRHTATHCR